MTRLAALGVAFVVLAFSAAAALAQSNLQTPHLSINGQTQQLVKPDAYTLIVGVETFAETHLAAMAENSRLTERVLNEAKQQGVDSRDLRTARIDLHPYDSGKNRYRAQNLIYVTLREIEKADQLVAALITAGANRVHGVRPVLKRDEDLLNKLRAEAVARAQRTATETAAAAGVRLGPILSINAQYYDWSAMMGGLQQRGVVASDLSTVPIEPGLVPVSMSVSITWSIQQ